MAEARTLVLRRQACQIVVMLPDDTEDAVAVLDYARELLTQFDEPEAGNGGEKRVIPFRR